MLQVAVFCIFIQNVFLFLHFLNLGAQIRCHQNQYIDLKLALDQPQMMSALAFNEFIRHAASKTEASDRFFRKLLK